MIIGMMAASTTNTISLTYLPEYLYFQAVTAPSALRVSVLGEGVLLDLDANGILALSNVRGVNRTANGFLLPLADGLRIGVNVEIVFTNTVAAVVPLYGFSTATGTIYFESARATLLANSGASFQDFAILALPSLAAGDTVDIHYVDGTTQRFHRDEIQALNMTVQNNILSYVIDNLAGQIHKVVVVPVAQQLVYMLRYKLRGDVTGVA